MRNIILSAAALAAIFCGQALATNITSATDPGDSEDRLTMLRGMADVLIAETRETGSLQEGEELIIRGGSSSGGSRDTSAAMNQAADRLGQSVQTNEIPDILRAISATQASNMRTLQEAFRQLRSKKSTPEEQQQLLKDIARGVAGLATDNLLLAGMRSKVQSLLSQPGDASTRAQLSSFLKMIGETQSNIQSFQNESASMAKYPFPTQQSSAAKMEEITQEQRGIAETIDAIKSELQSGDGRLSQDWFQEGIDKLNGSLHKLEELKAELQAVLASDPTNTGALALMRQLDASLTQMSGMIRDFAVVPVDAPKMTRLQNLKDTLTDSISAFKRELEAFDSSMQGADPETRKRALARLFETYDRITANNAEATALYNDVMRGASGQKYKTAEQREIEALWQQLSAAMTELGPLGDFNPATRDASWADQVGEEQEENAAQGPQQFELIDDVTADELNPDGGDPQYFLPVTPAASHDDAAAQLSGARIGGVLVKNGVTYGLALRDAGASELLSNDASSLRKTELVVFKIQNGLYTESASLGPYEIYNGGVHAAIALNSSDGNLDVFLNHTAAGDRQMTGLQFKIDPATLSMGTATQLFLGEDKGWAPRFDENGEVEHLYYDAFGNTFRWTGMTPIENTYPEMDFLAETDAAQNWNSAFTFGSSAGPGELPAEVVADRLSGETEAEPLGTYSYLSWGRWNDGAGVTDSIYVNSPWIAGSLTPAAGIPAAGSAVYNGGLMGKLDENGTISAIGGTTSLTADFSNRTLNGTFNMTKDNAAWKTAGLTGDWGAGTNSINGRLLTSDNMMSGAVKGAFFGPAAEQVGGAWSLQNFDASERAAGVFSATR